MRVGFLLPLESFSFYLSYSYSLIYFNLKFFKDILEVYLLKSLRTGIYRNVLYNYMKTIKQRELRMKVRLIVYSNLKDYVDGYRDGEGLLKEVPEQMSIKRFLQETIKHDKALDAISMVIVNEKVVPFNQIERNLQDGDIIKVYPPMGGG